MTNREMMRYAHYMGKILDAINNFLFPLPEGSEEDSNAPELRTTSTLIPPRNEHAYYANRLLKTIFLEHRSEASRREADLRERYVKSGIDYGGHHESDYDPFRKDRFILALMKLRLSTLKMMDAHHCLLDFDPNTSAFDEDVLRNRLLVNAYPQNQKYRLDMIGIALDSLSVTHRFPHADLTKAPSRQVELISAACGFLVETNLFMDAPPRLTEFVMQRPDRVDDIIRYMNTHCKERSAAHFIDLGHVANFLDCPAPAFQEGTL
jgi:hypothetical protein